MDAATITHPIAAKDDPAVATAPSSDALNADPLSTPISVPAAKPTLPQVFMVAMIILGVVAFLYVARPVVLPVVMACIAAMALKPLVRWADCCHVPPVLSAAVVLGLLMAAIGMGFLQSGRPAMAWMNEAPQHISELRQRVQVIFPRLTRFSKAAAAVNNLGAAEDEQKMTTVVEVKTNDISGKFINWTGTFLVGAGETVILLYLLLASGDLFLQKLVHLMPTLGDKKRAVEISHEIQQSISHYLFTVSLINMGLGLVVGGGFYFMGVPNATMWGILVALLNFIPYFGPGTGIMLLTAVGFLTFDTLWQALLPAAWYLLLHGLESNLVTPVLLGRRFTISPVVIFVSLIFWTWLWGVTGALLSVPILVSFKVVCDRIPAMTPVSDLLSRSLAYPVQAAKTAR